MLYSLNIHLHSIQIMLLLFSAGSVQVFDGLQTTVKRLECYAFKKINKYSFFYRVDGKGWSRSKQIKSAPGKAIQRILLATGRAQAKIRAAGQSACCFGHRGAGTGGALLLWLNPALSLCCYSSHNNTVSMYAKFMGRRTEESPNEKYFCFSFTVLCTSASCKLFPKLTGGNTYFHNGQVKLFKVLSAFFLVKE